MDKFVAFIKATPIIYDYVLNCGSCDWDMDEAFQEIRQSYGRSIFVLGDTDEEEVYNVFVILDYVAEKEINVSLGIAASLYII